MGNCSCNPNNENELNIETNPNLLPKRNPSHFKQQPSLDQVSLNSNIDIGKTYSISFLIKLNYIIFFR